MACGNGGETVSGPIDLPYPFIHSWIWEEESKKGVIMSMIVVEESEQRKGHTRKLIHQLKQKYERIVVPLPSKAFKELLASEGFNTGIEEDGVYCLVWTKEAARP